MRSRFPDVTIRGRRRLRAATAFLALALTTAAARSAAALEAPQTAPPAIAGSPVLRVCADPNNLPFSNAAGQGFENRIAELFARELGRKLEYTWWAQRRGFLRNTLKAGLCDLVVGVPAALDMALTGAPYYRSIYVFVTARERGLDIRSFDDARLRELRVGVQLIGDDGANSPPVHALTRRHISGNLVGFSIYGDYSRPDPTGAVVEAVASGAVDVAIVWGPQAAWFAAKSARPLALTKVEPEIDQPFLPLAWDISFAVRRGEESFRDELDAIAARRRSEIESILDEFGVPRLPAPGFAARPPTPPEPDA